jgi:hypothetical protein
MVFGFAKDEIYVLPVPATLEYLDERVGNIVLFVMLTVK